MRPILLWLKSILVLGTFFTPTFSVKTGHSKRSWCFSAMLKFFVVQTSGLTKNWVFPKTVRFRGDPAQQSWLTAKYTPGNSFSTGKPAATLGGEKPLLFWSHRSGPSGYLFSTTNLKTAHFFGLFAKLNALSGYFHRLLAELCPEQTFDHVDGDIG